VQSTEKVLINRNRRMSDYPRAERLRGDGDVSAAARERRVAAAWFVIVAFTGLTIPIAAIGQALAGVAAVTMPFALAGGTLICVTSNEIIAESHSHGNEGTPPPASSSASC